LNIQPQRPQLGINKQESLNIQPQIFNRWVSTYDILKKWWPLILSVLVGTIAVLFQISITNILLSVILTLITCWIIKTILENK
jgi:hypothetical protein